MTRDELLSALPLVLEKHERVRLAILFGSAARGTAKERSDIDLAVLGDADPLDLGAALCTATEREVDVVNLAAVTIPMLDAIVRDGIVVFEREAGSGALWRSRSLASLEIDRPWYGRMQNAWLSRVAERGVLGQ